MQSELSLPQELPLSHEGTPSRHGAYAAIIKYNTQHELQLLVSYSPLSQTWTFPGGGRKEGETTRDTVMREVRQETGLTIFPEQNPFLVAIVPNFFGGEQTASFYEAEASDGEPQATDEMSDHRWITEADAVQLVNEKQMDEFVLLGFQHVRLRRQRRRSKQGN